MQVTGSPRKALLLEQSHSAYLLTVDYRQATHRLQRLFHKSLRPSLENFNTTFADPAPENVQITNPYLTCTFQSWTPTYADVPSGLPWPLPNEHLMFARPYLTNHYQHISPYLTSDYPETMQLQEPYSPYSTPSLYDDSPLQSPYLSSSNVMYALQAMAAVLHGALPMMITKQRTTTMKMFLMASHTHVLSSKLFSMLLATE